LRLTSIAQIYPKSFINLKGTNEPYQETSAFWTNPDNIITTEDLNALYWRWEGEDYKYCEPEEEIGQVGYVGYYSDGRRSSPDFEIPEVYGGNKR